MIQTLILELDVNQEKKKYIKLKETFQHLEVY